MGSNKIQFRCNIPVNIACDMIRESRRTVSVPDLDIGQFFPSHRLRFWPIGLDTSPKNHPILNSDASIIECILIIRPELSQSPIGVRSETELNITGDDVFRSQ
jgi:hypothetical protein